MFVGVDGWVFDYVVLLGVVQVVFELSVEWIVVLEVVQVIVDFIGGKDEVLLFVQCDDFFYEFGFFGLGYGLVFDCSV